MFVLNENSSAPATFAEAWNLAWENHLKHLKNPKNELLRYKKHLLPSIGTFELTKISPFLLDQLKNYLLDKGYKAQTVTHILGLIRRVFNLLILWGFYEQVNPVRKIKLPKEDNRRMRFLNPPVFCP